MKVKKLEKPVRVRVCITVDIRRTVKITEIPKSDRGFEEEQVLWYAENLVEKEIRKQLREAGIRYVSVTSESDEQPH